MLLGEVLLNQSQCEQALTATKTNTVSKLCFMTRIREEENCHETLVSHVVTLVSRVTLQCLSSLQVTQRQHLLFDCHLKLSIILLTASKCDKIPEDENFLLQHDTLFYNLHQDDHLATVFYDTGHVVLHQVKCLHQQQRTFHTAGNRALSSVDSTSQASYTPHSRYSHFLKFKMAPCCKIRHNSLSSFQVMRN